MWNGEGRVAEAISDTGPILHLQEVGWQAALGIFTHLILPDLVAEELRAYGLDPLQFDLPDVTCSVVPVPVEHWHAVIHEPRGSVLHPADAQVVVVAQATQFHHPVLTDDLALRRWLEEQGSVVVGSIGVLVRAYQAGRLHRSDLDMAVEAVFDHSTLHLSRAFRAYVRQVLLSVP
jgi:predicted nucleic acid-binding protein